MCVCLFSLSLSLDVDITHTHTHTHTHTQTHTHTHTHTQGYSQTGQSYYQAQFLTRIRSVVMFYIAYVYHMCTDADFENVLY